MVAFKILKNLTDSLVNISKRQKKTKGEPLLSEQSLFVDGKQASDSKIFVSNTIEDQTKIENYNNNEICAGVVKLIVPESHLRSYPESESSLNVSLLIQTMRRRTMRTMRTMRSHFSEKDTSATPTEMSHSVKYVNESTYDFVVTLMSNRGKVLIFAIILASISNLPIKQAVTNSHASGSEQTLPHRNFQRCPNCTVTKLKCAHCFVCGSEDLRKSVCPYKD